MKRQQMVLPWVLLVIPVLWLAALLASGYKDGMTLFDLMAVFPTLMEKPFAIRWTPHTLKFLLIGLAAMAVPPRSTSLPAKTGVQARNTVPPDGGMSGS